MRQVMVNGVRPYGMFSTILIFDVTDIDDESNLVIGVDHRPARELRAALDAGELPIVEVEDWQVIG